MKIMIIGHLGRLGFPLFKSFCDAGHEVFGVDNRTDHDSNVDIRDREAIVEHIDLIKPEIVLHLAAIPDPVGRKSIEQMERIWAINVEGTRNVIYGCLKAKVRHFVYYSSGAVYGWDDIQNCGEEKGFLIDPYPVTKRTCEDLTRWASGPKSDPDWNMKCSVLRSAPYGDSALRNFYYACSHPEDVLEITELAINNQEEQYAQYFVCAKEQVDASGKTIKPMMPRGRVNSAFDRVPCYKEWIN